MQLMNSWTLASHWLGELGLATRSGSWVWTFLEESWFPAGTKMMIWQPSWWPLTFPCHLLSTQLYLHTTFPSPEPPLRAWGTEIPVSTG